MTEMLLFLAGMLLCNAIPHLAAGLRGEAFPTPFARPRGMATSSPIANTVWGSANLLGGAALLVARSSRISPWFALLAVAVGFILMGLYLAWYFGGWRRTRRTGDAVVSAASP